eukprot:Unigene11084_Nuclearia_a/m.33897 Unigene11084_Nuclearia_a/g.33897  ORF Unigene11084_Nuclearia_a/g.33897 Unigene11084_Nuclearia_a/m.33897 type:complete len:385 (-) Unigene11084_Nuclearia_a:319-1473(-)
MSCAGPTRIVTCRGCWARWRTAGRPASTCSCRSRRRTPTSRPSGSTATASGTRPHKARAHFTPDWGATRSAFVSIMRGCDNMCSFCVVPFTRGRERSRPITSVLDEVRKLVDGGVKEVTLLGQNVNSYRDVTQGDDALSFFSSAHGTGPLRLSRGFKTVYKQRDGGLRFADLLDKVSMLNPELRVRFTSPHPKDFPDELLALIQERHNIAKAIHLPAQSGSSSTLERMRRGYSREAYLALVEHIRAWIPSVALSTDIIAGFCGETEDEHRDTVELLARVQFDAAFMFAYSLREKTHAHRHYVDDVPPEVKQRRLQEIIAVFQRTAARKNAGLVGSLQVVLVEGEARRRADMDLSGRADCNRKVCMPRCPGRTLTHTHRARAGAL